MYHLHPSKPSCKPNNFKFEKFEDEIEKLSPEFCRNYNESRGSEENGWDGVCGPGYRKALEFLIKDFVIHTKPDKKQAVEKALLGPIIQNYIDDIGIKSMASRAAWLGNDETHYIRKWPELDVQDCKKLIEITKYYVIMVLKQEKYTQIMDEPRK